MRSWGRTTKAERELNTLRFSEAAVWVNQRGKNWTDKGREEEERAGWEEESERISEAETNNNTPSHCRDRSVAQITIRPQLDGKQSSVLPLCSWIPGSLDHSQLNKFSLFRKKHLCGCRFPISSCAGSTPLRVWWRWKDRSASASALLHHRHLPSWCGSVKTP